MMMSKITYFFVASIAFLINCDTKKEYTDDIKLNLICYTLASCNHLNASNVGMIGDSWTDLLLGFPAIDTLRIQLEKNHGYKITGATLGGKTLSEVINQGIQYQVIDQSGADIHTIILSLGGNDLQANLKEYLNNGDSVQASRLNQIKTNLRNLIQSGNAYKQSRFGGAPIKWIIHGYDYANPDKGAAIPGSDEGCTTKFVTSGFNLTNVSDFTSKQLDGFNEMLRSITSDEPTYYYVNLRRTLGGPPVSKSTFMFDCIHPNNLGFELLGNKLATQIAPITGMNL